MPHDKLVPKNHQPGNFEVVDDQMVAILKQKTPFERLEMTVKMWQSARNLLLLNIAKSHPEWSSAEVKKAVAARLSHGAV
jgi:hypothetical protein